MGFKRAPPGKELFLRELVAAAGFLNSDDTGEHCRHDRCFAAHDQVGLFRAQPGRPKRTCVTAPSRGVIAGASSRRRAAQVWALASSTPRNSRSSAASVPLPRACHRAAASLRRVCSRIHSTSCRNAVTSSRRKFPSHVSEVGGCRVPSLDNSGQKIDIRAPPAGGRVAYRGAARGFPVRLGADPVHLL